MLADPASSSGTFRDFLAAFSRAAGIDGLAPRDGRCAVRANDELTATIEQSADGEWIFFYAPLGEIPQNDEGAGVLCRRLLEWNFLGIETRGSALCIDPQRREILLQQIHRTERHDEASFVEDLTLFIDTALRFKARLDTAPEALPSAANEIRI